MVMTMLMLMIMMTMMMMVTMMMLMSMKVMMIMMKPFPGSIRGSGIVVSCKVGPSVQKALAHSPDDHRHHHHIDSA